jgi:hypothetical protein
MNKLTEKDSSWTTPGGYCKLLEIDDVVIRWYSDNKSLTISGKASDEFKTQLRTIISLMESADTSTTEALNNSSGLDEGDGSRSGVEIQGESTYNYEPDLTTVEPFRSYLLQLEERFEHKFEQLANEIREVKISGPTKEANVMCNNTTCDGEYRGFLRKEHSSLKEENSSLLDQVNNYKFILSDMKAKINDLENEKSSLITVIKILQEDQPQDNEKIWRYATNGSKQKNQSARTTSPTTLDNEEQLRTNNRYSILSVSDNEDEDYHHKEKQCSAEANQNTSTQNNPGSPTTLNKQPQGRSKPELANKDRANENSKHRNQDGKGKKAYKEAKRVERPTEQERRHLIDGDSTINNNTIIVGDSMLKMLNVGRMRRSVGQNVVIKTFPGAKTSDMKHYVQPAVLMKPKRMVIHVGTNDISKGAEPKAVVNGIEDLCKGIVNSNKSIQIAISEIITRDNLELNTKIKTANELLNNICLKHGWQIIQHRNIHVNNLNASGLHLNRVGTSLLAKNFIEFLNADSN